MPAQLAAQLLNVGSLLLDQAMLRFEQALRVAGHARGGCLRGGGGRPRRRRHGRGRPGPALLEAAAARPQQPRARVLLVSQPGPIAAFTII